MSFLRPEAARTLKRWREALIGGAVMLWGLNWAVFSLGLWVWFGVALALIGAAIAWSGIQRARFVPGSGGLGVVYVDERQISYLAPVGGGVASINALTRVTIARDSLKNPMWRFDSPGERLSIPAAAEKARDLFDVLTALPGAHIEAAIRALQEPPETPVTIWSDGQVHPPHPIDTASAIGNR